jgi:Tfp pilus assembly protein PilN
MLVMMMMVMMVVVVVGVALEMMTPLCALRASMGRPDANGRLLESNASQALRQCTKSHPARASATWTRAEGERRAVQTHKRARGAHSPSSALFGED